MHEIFRRHGGGEGKGVGGLEMKAMVKGLDAPQPFPQAGESTDLQGLVQVLRNQEAEAVRRWLEAQGLQCRTHAHVQRERDGDARI